MQPGMTIREALRTAWPWARCPTGYAIETGRGPFWWQPPQLGELVRCPPVGCGRGVLWRAVHRMSGRHDNQLADMPVSGQVFERGAQLSERVGSFYPRPDGVEAIADLGQGQPHDLSHLVV